MEKLNIAGRLVGPGEPPYIVAEIGANHNGDMALCRAMIDSARACGADAVKFQSWSKSSLISRAEYDRNTAYVSKERNQPTLEESVEQYQLSRAQHQEISAYCRDTGIVFFSSCFSAAEVDMLEALDVPAYKIASMDVNYLPLLEYVAATHKPVVISAGMATLGEVERAIATLRAAGSGPVAILHCLSIYPSPPAQVNLRTMNTWRSAFDVPVGYSDHTLGSAVPIAAVALGACMIEKHFTTDKNLPGWDHAISADPAELRAIVDGARDAFAALGNAERRVSADEIAKRKVFRRRMVARRDMRKGDRVAAADVDFKRPGTGIQPDELRYVIGRAITRDVRAEDELDWSDLA
ncbi:MAG TPA: N-acetylneuraminate synthase family protein [Gemmatimonadaceae bacterium]|nr:N-acetylneuraminate synthase family protein [Gemmatimonadaceae bacterium]